ncbi:nucleotide sugar dehydrogenase [Mesorhizobium sp. 1B3]|uniref:nucleotide sugar dehydrogenase n=1 Tax=Mesorhizobium sp. 1B3 TaxID=3243599 RepID=UPI003D99F4AD
MSSLTTSSAFPALDNLHVGIIGLGYVGLPLAIVFAKHFRVTGFDVDEARIAALRAGIDRTGEATPQELSSENLDFSADRGVLRDCKLIIVAVPTPIDQAKQPDLRPLFDACRTVGEVITEGTTVVFESTVYPGATEEDCVPLIESVSGLRCNRDFFVGYSPERVNPGDPTHKIETVVKVTSGGTAETAEFVDSAYRQAIPAGTYKAPSIRVAEAAKIVENTQRDVNIALVNELAVLFGKMGIDTLQVLETAGTKWNFLPFRPGLVGGHCIGVDPYYLTHKARQLNFHPEMVQAARRINDDMGEHVAIETVRLLLERKLTPPFRTLVLGFTFKENCRDIRNSRVVDIVRKLRGFNVAVDVHDPEVDPRDVRQEYGLELRETLEAGTYDAAIVAVGHKSIREMGVERVRRLLKPQGIVFDVKGIFPMDGVDARL